MAGAGCWPPASSEQNLASRLLRLGLIQPRARARLAGIQLDRPSARRLRRGGGRCAPRCGLGHHSGELCEECVGSLAPELSAYAEPSPRVNVAVAARIMVLMVSLLLLVWPLGGLLP